MCRSPIILPNGCEVACRGCDRCRYNRVKDWVGRCIAESKTAVATHAITFTYGRDSAGRERHERTAVLTYSDMQDYFKRLRYHGYPVRYFITGEYGKTKGRAHWHGILFFQEKVPPHVLHENFNDDLWPHGHQHWDTASTRAVKYVCKYIHKDVDDANAQSKLTMSKMPALGGVYFRQLAARYVAEGLAPKGPFYRFPEARKPDGKPTEFYMRGATARDFAEAYVLEWYRKRPGQHIPPSEFIEGWLDKQVPEWRSSEKVFKLAEAAKARSLLVVAEERKRFVDEHNRHYFGRNMRGFYNAQWRPEYEQEEESEAYGNSILAAIDGTNPEFWRSYYKEADELADRIRSCGFGGDAY